MNSKLQEFKVALYGCPEDASLETVKSLTSSAFGPFPSLPSRRFQAPLSPSFPWIVSFEEARTAQAFVRAHHEVVRSGSGKGTGDDQVFWDCWIGWQGVSLKVLLFGKDGKTPKLASMRPSSSTNFPSHEHPLPPRPRTSTPPQPSPNSSSILAPSNTQLDYSPPRSTKVYSSSLFFPDKSTSPSPQSSPQRATLSKKRSVDSPSGQPALRGVPFIKRMRVISPTEVENEVKIESFEVVLEEVPTPDLSPKGGSTWEGDIARTTTTSPALRREEEVASNPRPFFAEDAFERADGEPPKRRPYFKAKGIPSGESGSCGQEAIQKASSRLSSVINESPPCPASLQDGVRRLVEGFGANVPLPASTHESLLLSPLIIVQPAPAPDLLVAFEPSRLQAQPSSSSYPSPAATPTNPFSLDYPRSLSPDLRNPARSILVRPTGASPLDPELAHLKVPRKTVRFGSCPPL